MAHPIRRLARARRRFLRGSGVALALPWLDAHLPVLARPRPARPARAVWVFAPNGIKMDDWTPKTDGADFELPHLLEPFAALRDRMLVVSGLGIDAGKSHGDGPGDHARASSTFLTCEHPYKTGGADIRVGTSIDQLTAQAIGRETTFPSLELGMEGGSSAGVCDSGYSCAYSNNISWRTPTTPVAKEIDPRAVFARLFGDPSRVLDAGQRAADRARTRSVLDVALADAKGLQRRLAPQDRRKLGEYLDAVRDVEQRLQRIAEQDEQARREVPVDVLERHAEVGGYRERLRLMYDLIALALQTDSTRVVSFMLGNGGSNRSYREVGVSGGHHALSHHRGDPKKIAAIRKINRFHTEELARFLEHMQDIDDGDGSLLDGAMVLFGSGLSDGNRHDHDDVPAVVFGSGHGRLRGGGRHLRAAPATPLANLHLSLAHAAGAELETFADATGPLAGLG